MSQGGHLRATAHLGASQVVVAVGGIVATTVLARAMGPEHKGLYDLGRLLATTTASVAAIGLPAAATHLRAKGNRDSTTIWTLAAVTGLVSLAAALALGLRWETVFGALTGWQVAIAAALAPITLALQVSHGFLTGMRRFRELARVRLLGAVFFLAAALAVATLDLGATQALAAWLAVTVASTGIAMSFGRQDGPTNDNPPGEPQHRRWSGQTARQALSFGGRIHLGSVLSMANYRLDQFFIAAYLSTEAVALYVVAVMLTEQLWIVSQASSTIVLPKSSSGAADAEEATAQAARLVLVLTVIGAILLGATAWWIVPTVIGSDFAGAVSAVILLLPGTVALAVSRVLANHIAGSGRPGLTSSTSAVAVALNVVLNMVMVPRWGLEGAAVASSASYAVSLGSRMVLWKRLTGRGARDLLPQRAETAEWIAAAKLGLRQLRSR